MLIPAFIGINEYISILKDRTFPVDHTNINHIIKNQSIFCDYNFLWKGESMKSVKFINIWRLRMYRFLTYLGRIMLIFAITEVASRIMEAEEEFFFRRYPGYWTNYNKFVFIFISRKNAI